eukprot:evm.model.scf_1087.2 EVM.evm.TU.scf_1087.2   scf_1087:41449-44427(+)
MDPGAVVEEIGVRDAEVQVPEGEFWGRDGIRYPAQAALRRHRVGVSVSVSAVADMDAGGAVARAAAAGRLGGEGALLRMVGGSTLDADGDVQPVVPGLKRLKVEVRVLSLLMKTIAEAGGLPRKELDSHVTSSHGSPDMSFGARMERGDVRPEDRKRLEALLQQITGPPGPPHAVCIEPPAQSTGQSILVPLILPRREGSVERKRKLAAELRASSPLFAESAVAGRGVGMKTEAQDAIGALAGRALPRISQVVVPESGAPPYSWESTAGIRVPSLRPATGALRVAGTAVGGGDTVHRADATSTVEAVTSARRVVVSSTRAPVTCVVCRAARGENELLGCPQGHRVCWKTERGDAPVCVRKLQMLGFKAMHGRMPTQSDDVNWITGMVRSWRADVAPKLFTFSGDDSGEEHFCAICYFTEQGARLKAVRKDMEMDSITLVPYWKALRPHVGEGSRGGRDAVGDKAADGGEGCRRQ